MNKLVKILSLSALVAFTASCNQSTSTETKVSEKDSTENATSEVVEESTDESNVTVVLNPNLATPEELEATFPIDLVDKVMANRPFMSMTDLDAMIGDLMDSTQKAALYNKAFVPFNLNTTPEEDFKLIPGVGDRMAHEFEEYRPYLKIAQFRKEIGKYVDEAEVARYENFVFVPVELNTATKEEILAIPGVGDRMLHEFEEYRPYESMEQFRKEIGKYVDAKELARLERYVYIKK